MAFADSFAYKFSKSAYPSPFFRFLQGPMGEPLSWACQVGRWNFLTSQAAPVTSLPPRGAPPGPNDVIEAQRVPGRTGFSAGAAVPRARLGLQTWRGRSPGWCALQAPCCFAQGQPKEGNRQPDFAKGPLKFSLEYILRTFAKSLETWCAPSEAVGVSKAATRGMLCVDTQASRWPW